MENEKGERAEVGGRSEREKVRGIRDSETLASSQVLLPLWVPMRAFFAPETRVTRWSGSVSWLIINLYKFRLDSPQSKDSAPPPVR